MQPDPQTGGEQPLFKNRSVGIVVTFYERRLSFEKHSVLTHDSCHVVKLTGLNLTEKLWGDVFFFL